MIKFAFLLVFLTACDPSWEWDHPRHPHAVSTGSDPEVWTDMVEAARLKWSTPLIAMGCSDPFESTEENDVILVPSSVWQDPHTNGNTEREAIYIRGTTEELENNFSYEATIPHELGHALGLRHVSKEEDAESIMHPLSDKSVPSLRDLDEVARHIGCL